ncbi:MAG: NAD(P)-binding domain-containing protein [Pseudomonadaceae bacterium]|nr:NAD(P)-binding domain-containing protein [Pseudomonadaceae bacterium]
MTSENAGEKRSPLPVCVVGAGPTGLVATKTLLEAGLEVVCLEGSDRVGGHWSIDNPNGRSAVYESLTTNTTKRMSRFSDFQMPNDWPDFPTHRQVQQWLVSYADKFGLMSHIHLGWEVINAQPNGPNDWTITARRADGSERTHRVQAVIAASGNYWQPRMPDWPGEFAGTLMHARQYRSPQRPVSMVGKRVVIVGLGNTACDLAVEIADAGAQWVGLSARSGTWILPRFRPDGTAMARSAPFNHPYDEIPLWLRLLPERIREAAYTQLTRRVMRKRFAPLVSRMKALGLPPPPDDPLAKRATVNQHVLDRLASGSVVAKADIAALDAQHVDFADGSRERVDAIICATGYNLHYPYLSADLLNASLDDMALYRGVVAPARDDLFVIGVYRPNGGFWPIAEVQAQYIAQILTGEASLPPAHKRAAHTAPVLNRVAINPGLYALSLRRASGLDVPRGTPMDTP